MAGLPKIVRHRLGQALGTTEHPDANLLAGLVEHSLSARERSVVLGHLSRCAECRELVSVALPHSEATTGATVAARGSPGWLRWPVLRWAFLVTSLVIMGAVALVRQPSSHRVELASRSPSMLPGRAPLPSDVTIGAAPKKAEKTEGHSRQEIAALKEKSATELALGVESGRKTDKALNLPLKKKEAQDYEVPLLSEARPSANAVDSNQPSATIAAQAAPQPPAPGAKAILPPPRPIPRTLELMNSESSKTEASRAPEESKEKTGGGAGGGAVAVGGVMPGPPTEKTSENPTDSLMFPPSTRQATLAKNMHVMAPSAGLGAASMSPTTMDWSISATGRVRRSRDGRETWEELDVDKNVTFRVIFAVGPDVWLGGTKGALYHSTDGGQHWTRVSISSGSTTVTDDIVHIEFKDSETGTVKTARGDTWTTRDAGQHWEKQ